MSNIYIYIYIYIYILYYIYTYIYYLSISIYRKSDLTDKIKCSFFQVMLILLYQCATWTLTKCMQKKLDGNYTRMLQAILNKSWRQHPTSSSCTATYHPS